MLPKPRSSPAPDDSPTPNIAEYIKSIPSWSPEEQSILEKNMIDFPISQNAEFKRLTLLMTNLPNKRLRDVSLRVKYLKANETQDISWETFLQNSFGQQKVELSPSHSIKSPRATPIEKEEKIKRPKRQNPRVKKEEEEMSRESTNQLSVHGSTLREREMSISSANQPMMTSQPIHYPQMSMGQSRMQLGNPVAQPQLQHNPYGRSIMQSQPYPSQMMFPPRERMLLSIEEQNCERLIYDNDRCLEIIINALVSKGNDLGDSVTCFHANINKLLQLTSQMAQNSLPLFSSQPTQIPIPSMHKFKKIEIPPEHMRQPSYGEFQLGSAPKSQRDDGRRTDMM